MEHAVAALSADWARPMALLEAAVRTRQISAAALWVEQGGNVRVAGGCGQRLPSGSTPAVDEQSVFLLASITKPITVLALLQLVADGKLSIDDPVVRYLPELAAAGDGNELRGTILVRHLLSHIAGLPDMLPDNTQLRRRHAPLRAFVDGALRTPLLAAPGTHFSYQSMATLLAAEIVERLAGAPLRQVMAQRIFTPLGLQRTALGLGSFAIDDTVWCRLHADEDEEQRSCGWNSHYWRDLGAPWGGLHGSAADIGRLLRTVLAGGTLDGARILDRSLIHAMTHDQNDGLDAPWGLGFALRHSRAWNRFGDGQSAASFGHTGATGTIAWADPELDLVCVVLTNYLSEDGALLRRVSSAVAQAGTV